MALHGQAIPFSIPNASSSCHLRQCLSDEPCEPRHLSPPDVHQSVESDLSLSRSHNGPVPPRQWPSATSRAPWQARSCNGSGIPIFVPHSSPPRIRSDYGSSRLGCDLVSTLAIGELWALFTVISTPSHLGVPGPAFFGDGNFAVSDVDRTG